MPRYATPALLILTAVVFAAIFTDYGITWDEGAQATYGELVLDYFGSAGRDERCHDYFNLRYYGPLFESATAAVYERFDGWKFEIRHAATGATALLTLVAVWRFGRRLGSPAVSFYAVLSLLMMPRFVGHAFNNSKDVPFACAFAWAMLGIARLLGGRRWRWSDVLLCGTGVGLALSIRVGGLILLAFLVGGAALSLMLWPEERRRWRERPLDRGLKLAVIAVAAWTLMVVAWPWVHAAPLVRPLIALSEMSGFAFSYPVFFAGDVIPSHQLPRHYLPLYLAIVTPLPVIGLAWFGLAASLRQGVARPREKRTLPTALVLVWLLVPMAYVVATRPNVYDGIRHFLFLLPGLALLGGLGAAWILDHLQVRWRRLGATVLAMVLSLPLVDQVALHPYQSSYFNLLVGGVGEAWRRFDTDYWASSYREAMGWVVREAGSRPGRETVVVVACNDQNRPCAESYLPASDPAASPSVAMHCIWSGDEPLPADAHYYVAMLRYGKAATFFSDWPVVHRVGRRGAVFSVVKRNPALESSD